MILSTTNKMQVENDRFWDSRPIYRPVVMVKQAKTDLTAKKKGRKQKQIQKKIKLK